MVHGCFSKEVSKEAIPSSENNRAVLSNKDSLQEESFSGKNIKNEKKGLLEYPQYTRPDFFKHPSVGGKKYSVPKVLLRGDHKKISEWRKKHGKMT